MKNINQIIRNYATFPKITDNKLKRIKCEEGKITTRECTRIALKLISLQQIFLINFEEFDTMCKRSGDTYVKPRLDQILDRINDFSRTTNFLSELHASDSIIIKINDDRMPSTINYSPIIQAMNNKLATTVLFKNLLISFKDYL